VSKSRRINSRSFYLSSQLLPFEKRMAVRALYAFCRTSDDTVDRATDDPARALAQWVARVHAPHPPADHPCCWHGTIQCDGMPIPQSLVDELLAGIAMDLTFHRYETFEDLWLYCYRVASVVGLLSMHIIGHRDGAAPYAVKLGVALQLTNILRDVGEDARRGRIYLPQEDLRRFDLTDDDILQGRRDERFRALMRFEIERTHALYDEAWPGIALLDPDGRMAIAAAAEIYRGILPRIVANDYDVFQKTRLCSARGQTGYPLAHIPQTQPPDQGEPVVDPSIPASMFRPSANFTVRLCNRWCARTCTIGYNTYR
jgi:phytoene synthase